MKRRRGIRRNDEQHRQSANAVAEEQPTLELLIGVFIGGVFLLALLVSQQARWTLTVLDGIFWAMAAAAVVARQSAVAMARDKPVAGGRWRPALIGFGVVSAVWLVAQAMGGEAS